MNLEDIWKFSCYIPHPDIHTGDLIFSGDNTLISRGARIDLTGTIRIGDWCMIGEGARILTHDHYHEGRDKPLLLLQQEKGVKWQGKVIQDDVWLHECIILYQVTLIPTGTVMGAGTILTKNPEAPYGIYAGNPGVRIGER